MPKEPFAGVSTEFVLRVCEICFSKMTPRDRHKISLGGVSLKLYISIHRAGFERVMLLGQDWTVGFNLQPTEDAGPHETAQVVKFNAADQVMFTAHVSHEGNFLRDMTVLMMTASEWSEEFAEIA